jgi:hypothetical protein
MLMDSMMGLAAAIIVLSSVAWVSQFRKIRSRIRAKKAARQHREDREHQEPAKAA